MDISRVDHIGIAVTNLDETIKFYTETLGVKCHGTETVEDQKIGRASCRERVWNCV
jgi:methylmalonyl-CoA/ethylmalonyl-CoA epimerase